MLEKIVFFLMEPSVQKMVFLITMSSIAILVSYGLISYLLLVIRWEVKLNKVTWFIRALAPSIWVAATIMSKWLDRALTTIIVTCIITWAIFFASFFNKKSYWKLGKLDYICLFISLAAIVLRRITDDPVLAISFAILADLIAAIPLFIKIYKAPETERVKPFIIIIIANTSTLMLTFSWKIDFIKHGFLAYLIILEAAIIVDFYLKDMVIKLKKSSERYLLYMKNTYLNLIEKSWLSKLRLKIEEKK